MMSERKVYLDLGGNKGQGLKQFTAKYNINKEWVVETYEPDPNCEINKHIGDNLNITVNNKAVWVYNGKVKFSQMLEDSQGSSVECLMSEGACEDEKSGSFRKHDSIIEVDCSDITDILNNYDDNDFIVVKMDIEGSEFKVLRKSLNDGSLNKVNDLWVEWHQEYVKGEDINTREVLKKEIRNKGINLKDWH